MKELIMITSMIITSFMNAGNDAEPLVCEVMPLAMYGMEGAETESICASLTDYTDFVIVDGYENGDILYITFVSSDEISKIKTIRK